MNPYSHSVTRRPAILGLHMDRINTIALQRVYRNRDDLLKSQKA